MKSAKKSPAKSPKTRKPKAEAPVAPIAAPAKLAAKPTTPRSPAKSADRTEASLAFAIDVARMAQGDKCYDVTVLDVRGLSPVTDYLVLATGTSGRQMASTADDVIRLGKDRGYPPLSSSGKEGETWVCVDFVDVLFHLFGDESRGYYDLEGLWGDATRVEFTPGPVSGS